jgi:hypothetical protein
MNADPDGLPTVGDRFMCLGVRDGEIRVEYGQAAPETGGPSVAPDDPMNLPRFLRPSELRGTGKWSVFEINEANLPSDLRYRDDPHRDGHGFLEPRVEMPIERYKDLLAETRSRWRMHNLSHEHDA